MGLTRDSLMTCLAERLGVDTADVDDDTQLFSTGLLDSFSMVELIMFVEEQAGIQFDPGDISLEHLGSVSQIMQYVNGRLQSDP